MNEHSQTVPNLGMTIPRGDVMHTPEAVAAMRQLRDLGWGIKRIARELGCSKNTVRHYLLPWRVDAVPPGGPAAGAARPGRVARRDVPATPGQCGCSTPGTEASASD